MQIQFFGAAGTVTGSCYFLTTDTKQQILVDLGMFQGPEVEDLNKDPLKFDSGNLSAVVVTHAHLDHCGRLPLLIIAGYKGKIYMTKETKLLVSLSLNDAVKVANDHNHSEHNQNHPILYTEKDVEKTLAQIETVNYGEMLLVGKLQIIFRNAGHILGSASLEISENGKTIVFSGDIGNPHQKLLQPAEHIREADVVIMEATYGDRFHPQQNALTTLQQEINTIENSGAVLLIPAFALDRTQVLLHLINHLKKEGKIKKETPVFLDSPMAIKATVIYKESKEVWSDELKSHTDDPFDFPNLFLTQEAAESEGIIKVEGPKVIIAGNGMITGGRIWHHLINYLPLSSTRLLMVGYQGEGTMGREILKGAKQVHIYHEEVNVNAAVKEEKGLSAHADQKELLNWLGKIKGVGKVFLTHSEETSRKIFSEKIQSELFIKDVVLPAKDSSYEIITNQ